MPYDLPDLNVLEIHYHEVPRILAPFVQEHGTLYVFLDDVRGVLSIEKTWVSKKDLQLLCRIGRKDCLTQTVKVYHTPEVTQ